jgi:hypothetical protein
MCSTPPLVNSLRGDGGAGSLFGGRGGDAKEAVGACGVFALLVISDNGSICM